LVKPEKLVKTLSGTGGDHVRAILGERHLKQFALLHYPDLIMPFLPGFIAWAPSGV
jgi:hypothetical protein